MGSLRPADILPVADNRYYKDLQPFPVDSDTYRTLWNFHTQHQVRKVDPNNNLSIDMHELVLQCSPVDTYKSEKR